jgi:hypothetical protein
MQLIPETAARFKVKDSFNIEETCAEVLRTCAGFALTTGLYRSRRRHNAGEVWSTGTRAFLLSGNAGVCSSGVTLGNAQHPYDPRIVKPASFLPSDELM